MSYKLEDFACAIERIEASVPRLNGIWNSEGVKIEMVESMIVELNFLYIYAGYAHNWSYASSYDSNTKLDSLYGKVDEFSCNLHEQFRNCEVSGFLSAFTSLNHEIDHSKSEVKEAYQDGSFFTTQSINPHPPSAKSKIHDWRFFCDSLRWNIKHLIKFLGDSMRMQMKALQQSLNLLDSLSVIISLREEEWSPWEEKMMAYIGGIFVQVAHLCCFCWYNAQHLDQETVRHDVETSLSDLLPKMNPDSPMFVDIALGFLPPYDKILSIRSVGDFLRHMLGLEGEKGVIWDGIEFALLRFIKLSESSDGEARHVLQLYKRLFLLARSLRGKTRSKHRTDYAILFAHIWSLRATEIHDYQFKKHLNAFHDGYKFLEEIFSQADEKSVEYQAWKVIQRLPDEVRSLYDSCKNEDAELILLKFCFLYLQFGVQMSTFKVKGNFLELLETHPDLMQQPLKSRIQTLYEEFCMLMDLVIITTKAIAEEEWQVFDNFDMLLEEILLFCGAFPAKNLMEEEIEKMNVSILDMSEKLHHMKAVFKGVYLQIPDINLPKIPGTCFIKFLSQNLRELLGRKRDMIASATHLIEAICSDLRNITSALESDFEQVLLEGEFEALFRRLNYVAYLTEYMVDLMVHGDAAAKRQHLVGLYHVADEIKNIKIELCDSQKYHKDGHGVRNIPQRVVPDTSRGTTAIMEQTMVGRTDQIKAIIDRLTGDRRQRDIVSIVGMPGIGKTTLANNVFCNRSVIYHFDVRAWCCVSQSYKIRDLLLEILSHIPTKEETHGKSDDSLKEDLRKLLKGRRYLIVMDDMWNIKAWDDLQLSFPDDSKGSRILITSRALDVVSKFEDPYPLRLLTEEESWDMLKSKIFQKEECPDKMLLEVGQEIAKNCKGLPLAINAIAGLLDRSCGRSLDLWKQIAKSVSSSLVNDPETQCKEIIELSYQNLPNHLKACFLYFGAFPEDRDILVSRLQSLWIAEGFVQKLGSKTHVEDLAEDCLMDLIGRSLVLVSKSRSNGKVKACQVHDVVRDLCILKAKEEKFWQPVSGSDEPYSYFDGLNPDVPLDTLNFSNSKTYKEYRLCFSMKRERFVALKPSGPFVRSLLFFAATERNPRCPYDVSFIPENYKRLRVLDLESINMGQSLANGMESLVDLRYLAVSGDMVKIPPSLSNMENLETLLVKSLKKVVLPKTIWRMKKLRHIHVTSWASFTLHHEEKGSSLHNLISLSFLCFTCGKETEELIIKFPNIQSLKCVAYKPTNIAADLCQFPALGSLRQLESLKMSYEGEVLKPGELNFPSSIKKLTLSNFRLPWNQMTVIYRLPKLEVLKLMSKAFEGLAWNVEEEEEEAVFANLKFLKLDDLDIECWNACSESFPKLQQIVVRKCMRLQEIPADFVGISTLQKIEVQQCGRSVEESVRYIKEQEILEGLEIAINNSYSAQEESY